LGNEEKMEGRGAEFHSWWSYHNTWQEDGGDVIEEYPISIYLNGIEVVSMMGTPLDQEWLAVGFLMNEGLINALDEIEVMEITPEGCCVDVWLDRPAELPERKVITTGCGGGITYSEPGSGLEPFDDDIRIPPDLLQEGFNTLQSRESLYARSRGVHAAGLLDPGSGNLEIVVEDVGRHNTIDKIRGASELLGINTENKILLSTGRISSEMLQKTARMRIPILASRTSPTNLSIQTARVIKMTLVGYVRYGRMRVYSSPERVGVQGEK
jgi:FdhD protein